MVLAAALSHGTPVGLEGKELVVAFSANDSFKRKRAESHAQLIGTTIRELSGAGVRLRFEEREVERAAAPEAAPTSEDLINRLKSEFDAEEIIPEEEPTP